VDIFLAVKPVPAKATPKLGRPCNKLPVLTWYTKLTQFMSYEKGRWN
jgi:hypothetical protein